VIVGIGIDVVPVLRFEAALARTAGMADRLFTPAEQLSGGGGPRSAESLAARFAAKEALAKALGSPGGMLWTDAEVEVDQRGRPYFTLRGTVREKADALGIGPVHLSISHDGGIASAVVICEEGPEEGPAPTRSAAGSAG
jgi:holo-[acyl-carrier protein] synthase